MWHPRYRPRFGARANFINPRFCRIRADLVEHFLLAILSNLRNDPMPQTGSRRKHPVIRHQVPPDDCRRAKTFDEKTFGWTFEPWGTPDFWLIHTGPGAIHGALQQRREPATGSGMIGFECSISVDNVTEIAAAIEQNGGTLTMKPFQIEGVGTLAMFHDTEGNVVGAMQYEAGADS